MSDIAMRAEIGRATLYKYFSSIDDSLAAWHERQLDSHLQELAVIAGGPDEPRDLLVAVLERYTAIQRRASIEDFTGALHRRHHVAHATHGLAGLLTELLGDAARAGAIRSDVPCDQLARFCINALRAPLGSELDASHAVALTLSALDAAD